MSKRSLRSGRNRCEEARILQDIQWDEIEGRNLQESPPKEGGDYKGCARVETPEECLLRFKLRSTPGQWFAPICAILGNSSVKVTLKNDEACI
ncbi:hypothetical protein AVEN_220914-1 [Araneus ventricosus]|uniref:Uncharacterized protein n=1 Tax=Araneus ventricosus TaxID=182803 RepID=A0A4Y2X0H6_ARAVE|nr:hypothetical protein AVEN_220914-1 [Araneus ventricosus]